MFLQPATKHHTNEERLLFQADNKGSSTTACGRVFLIQILYRSATCLRDSDGRNLDQAKLASGNITFESNGKYFMRKLSDNQLRDPATNLYISLHGSGIGICDFEKEPIFGFQNADDGQGSIRATT